MGSAAVQITRAMGFDVFALASPQHHAYVKTLGAKFVFDYRSAGVVAEIVDAAKEAGIHIKLAYDAVSERGTVENCLEILDKFEGGKLCMVLPMPEGLEASANVEVSMTMATRVATGVGYVS